MHVADSFKYANLSAHGCMGGQLTVSERILFHLNNYVKFEDKYEVPFDVTQDGISQACSISRAHAAIELKKLKATGVVDEKLSHVRRGKSRRKVYSLTPLGKAKAVDISQYVKDNGITTLVDATKVAVERAGLKIRPAHKSSPLPPIKSFFGRVGELEGAKDALKSPSIKVLSIKGIAGIGKTTLAAKLMSETTGQSIFWFSGKPWDTPRLLSESLSKFFSDNGSRRLSAYLQSGRFELGELSYLLKEELSENGYMFVFDDADSSEGFAQSLRMFKDSCGSAKVILTFQTNQGFYDASDVVARKEVIELELGGLDRASGLALLSAKGIEGEVAEDLVKATNGHPLSLEMVTKSSPVEARHQVTRFFEEKFYSGLGEDEKSLLQLSSVFQRPFPADAIPKELKHARKGSMLREVAPGRFEIHASLRAFVYDSMTKDERKKWHGAAADHYLRADDPRERLIHLVLSGRNLEAEILVSHLRDEILEEGDLQRLWGALRILKPSKPKYARAVELVRARTAGLVGEEKVAEELLTGLSRSGQADCEAEALVELGMLRSKQGEPKAAEGFFSEALTRAKDSPATRAKALRGLGMVASRLGDYEKAQELLETSAKEALSAMDSKDMLLSHLELGNVFIGKGMYQDAIDHFSKCAAGFGPVDLANAYVNMGIAFQYLGRKDEARRSLENAVRLADETGQARTKAYALTSLAEVLVKSGEPETAREHCFAALDILTELKDPLGISAAYANLSVSERESGDLAGAIEHSQESIAALESVDVPRILGVRKMEFGLLLAQADRRDDGLRELNESKDVLERAGASDLVSSIENELSRLSGG